MDWGGAIAAIQGTWTDIRSYPTRQRVLLVLYALGFCIGALSHTYDVVRGGLFPYRAAPFALNLFWSSLALWDAVTAALVLLRPRAGTVLAVFLMSSIVIVNLYAALAVPGYHPVLGKLGLLGEVLFALFVFATAPFLGKTESAGEA